MNLIGYYDRLCGKRRVIEMKKKIVSLISLIILGAGAGFNTLSGNLTTPKKENDNNISFVEKEKTKSEVDEEVKENQGEQSTEIVEESISNNSNETNAVESSNDKQSNRTGKEGTNNSTVKSETNVSIPKSPTSQPQPSSPPVQTEWGKLGISEYDYYNRPAPGEGEIAFSEAESKCDAVADNITNQYSFVTHTGDVRSRSENYLGCWITIHFADGSYMFYKEFMSRVNRGEFN